MVYKEKFVVAIKSGGKVLRETGDLVHLPFGSEFSILVKNLNNRRAKFRLSIDGIDALDENVIVVDANSSVEMERFIKDGNLECGNAFKFIERTDTIENGPRGIRVDDGLIRVEYWFERIRNRAEGILWTASHDNSFVYGQNDVNDPTFRPISNSVLRTGSSDYKSFDIKEVDTNDIGITVPGSKVDQKFTPAYKFESEEHSNVIIIKMIGKVGEKTVSEPITVHTKPKCITCGRKNKVSSKFCNECGTSLEII